MSENKVGEFEEVWKSESVRRGERDDDNGMKGEKRKRQE
jgi:hypothetical protein